MKVTRCGPCQRGDHFDCAAGERLDSGGRPMSRRRCDCNCETAEPSHPDTDEDYEPTGDGQDHPDY